MDHLYMRSLTLAEGLFYYNIGVCFQRLWVSMVPNPYLADTWYFYTAVEWQQPTFVPLSCF